MALRNQLFGHDTADETRAAGYENLQLLLL